MTEGSILDDLHAALGELRLVRVERDMLKAHVLRLEKEVAELKTFDAMRRAINEIEWDEKNDG